MGKGVSSGDAGRRSRVLVADDDRDVRVMIKTLLELDGHQVFEAADGKKAWQMIARKKPQIVVADIQMPGLDGLELCRKVKADGFKDTRIIVFTAGMATEHDSRRAGCDGYFLKTDPLSRLRDAVREFAASG
jgi:CheY-like chemotaxis protein